MKKYVKVDIYKNSGEASSGLISSRRDWAYLFAEGVSKSEIKQICDKDNLVYEDALQIETCRYSFGTYKHARPVDYDGCTAFGGAFVFTSNARFAELLGEKTGYALKLHDFVVNSHDILD